MDFLEDRTFAFGTALLIGLALAFLPWVLVSSAGWREWDIANEWIALALHTGLGGLPYAILAFAGIDDWRVWLVGIATSVVLCAMWWMLVLSSRDEATLTMTLLMLFSPAVVLLFTLTAHNLRT